MIRFGALLVTAVHSEPSHIAGPAYFNQAMHYSLLHVLGGIATWSSTRGEPAAARCLMTSPWEVEPS